VTHTYIFELDDGNQFSEKLKNVSLATGVRVTFLMFMLKKEKYLFSIYNHSDPVWKEIPLPQDVFYDN
jgi:hypothetical protein